MKYIAFNNGLQVKNVEPGHVTQNGEVAFDHFPNERDLTLAFPDFPRLKTSLALAAQAKLELERTHDVIMRHVENGVPVNPNWKSYRAKLRMIREGKSSETQLPLRPGVPEGV